MLQPAAVRRQRWQSVTTAAYPALASAALARVNINTVASSGDVVDSGRAMQGSVLYLSTNKRPMEAG